MNRTLTVAALVASCTWPGCKREVEPARWNAIDLEALRDSIDAPTGTVDEDSVSEIARDFVRAELPLDALLGLIEDVFTMSEQDGGVHAWRMPRLEGTNVFVEVSCPGPALSEPVLDFSEGRLRVDSPSLSEEYAETFHIEGDFLLSLDACRVDAFRYEGQSPGHYVVESRTLALDFAWEWEDLEDDGQGNVGSQVLWEIGQRVSLLYTLDDGDTVVIEWTRSEAEFEIRGRNGSFACSTGGDPPEPMCTAP